MKNKLLFALIGLIAAVSVFSAFDRPEATTTAENQHVVFDAGTVKPYYHKEYSLDTLTNAANDTLTLPVTLLSPFEGVFQIVRTSISGTANVALKVEQSNTLTGNTDWVSVSTGSGTGATTEALQLTSMNGLRYRVILDGTGTQSTSYRCHVTLKRKN